MSEKITLYSVADSDASRRRRIAVEAALEVIRAASLGGCVNNPGLYKEFENLSDYADVIQAALEAGSKDQSR